MNNLMLSLSKHKLIISTMIGVTTGTICGMSLKHYSVKSWSDRDIMYIKFPGEIFLRMVNYLILPLVTSSIISATCNLSKSVSIEEWSITSEYMAGTNVLGLVFHSLLLGLAIGNIGTKGKPLSDFFSSLADVMMKIMKWITFIAPIGASFLIAGRILEIDDFGNMISHLGFYILTVFIGLILQGFVILPFLHWIITRKSPYKIISKLGPSFATAIGTSSSTATVPYTIRCLEDLGINYKITKFLIPIGAAINMDGIALYETVGAIFIIQLRGLQFSLFKIIVISITCTVSCVGAAGIPSGGYMMLIMVLNSIGVPVEDVTLIIATDWFIDRFRTTINIIGDALGASIISRFCKEDLEDEMCPLKTNVICNMSA
ncbi:hypothetical protein ACFW04_001526 [Cataglyphis niger]